MCCQNVKEILSPWNSLSKYGFDKIRGRFGGTTHIPAAVQWILIEAVASSLGANTGCSNGPFSAYGSIAAARVYLTAIYS